MTFSLRASPITFPDRVANECQRVSTLRVESWTGFRLYPDYRGNKTVSGKTTNEDRSVYGLEGPPSRTVTVLSRETAGRNHGQRTTVQVGDTDVPSDSRPSGPEDGRSPSTRRP